MLRRKMIRIYSRLASRELCEAFIQLQQMEIFANMEMRLYCFRVGGIRFPEAPDDLPIYAYLIEHPKGRVLVDTGES